MFGKGMHLSVFYCLFYLKGVSTDILEEQVLEERYLDLNEEEDIILDAIREKHWRDVSEEVENTKKMHALSWEI